MFLLPLLLPCPHCKETFRSGRASVKHLISDCTGGFADFKLREQRSLLKTWWPSDMDDALKVLRSIPGYAPLVALLRSPHVLPQRQSSAAPQRQCL